MQATRSAHSMFNPVAIRQGNPAKESLAQSVESTELLRGQKTVEIKHNVALYRLQATKLGKLILTK